MTWPIQFGKAPPTGIQITLHNAEATPHIKRIWQTKFGAFGIHISAPSGTSALLRSSPSIRLSSCSLQHFQLWISQGIVACQLSTLLKLSQVLTASELETLSTFEQCRQTSRKFRVSVTYLRSFLNPVPPQRGLWSGVRPLVSVVRMVQWKNNWTASVGLCYWQHRRLTQLSVESAGCYFSAGAPLLFSKREAVAGCFRACLVLRLGAGAEDWLALEARDGGSSCTVRRVWPTLVLLRSSGWFVRCSTGQKQSHQDDRERAHDTIHSNNLNTPTCYAFTQFSYMRINPKLECSVQHTP